jgi:hypothetical protein
VQLDSINLEKTNKEFVSNRWLIIDALLDNFDPLTQ